MELIYRKFKSTGQETVRLEMALKGYFQSEQLQEQTPEQVTERAEFEGYLRRRVRAAALFLIKAQDLNFFEQFVRLEWLTGPDLDYLLQECIRMERPVYLMMLLQEKKRRFGFSDKSYHLKR